MSGFLFRKARLKVSSASRLRTDQVVFSLPNYISSTVLKRMSVIRFLIQKMRTVPQNVSWNQISGGFEFYSKLQCLNELFQLLRSSLHVRGFELLEHILRF